ncbi:MAG: hypothetical protein RLZZ429_915 [Bacteroidota bacterium]|jgi:polyisoprenoid-binding protein YceI
MMKIVFAAVMLLNTSLISAQRFSPIDAGSSVNFTIKNLGLNVTGKFTGLSGSIIFDPDNLSESKFSVSVNASSIDTDIKARDNHLKKEDYFYVERYPRISFISKTITKEGAGQYKVSGILEIKGTSKEIDFIFTTNLITEGYVFKGGFKINRRDFKVGGKSLILSDQLLVNLSVVAQKN